MGKRLLILLTLSLALVAFAAMGGDNVDPAPFTAGDGSYIANYYNEAKFEIDHPGISHKHASRNPVKYRTRIWTRHLDFDISSFVVPAAVCFFVKETARAATVVFAQNGDSFSFRLRGPPSLAL